MKIKVSVLVPIYKVPKFFLERCLKSLTSQTLEEIEIILVDDGSNDICSNIIDEYAESDSRIIAIHKNNGGLSSARNTAFEKATGEYITFVDGDDFIEENMCEIAYNIAKEKNVQMVFWDQITEYHNSSKVVNTNKFKEKIYRKEECRELQERVLEFNGKIAQVFSKLINREFLLKNNIVHHNELKQGAEGLVFNIELFEFLESAYYVQIPMYHYVFNENSISHSFNKENYDLVVKCFEYIEKYIRSSSNYDKLIEKLYTRVLYAIVTSAITGYFNPYNNMKFKDKVCKYKKFLNNELIQKSLKNGNKKELSISRRIIIFCIKNNFFALINIMAQIRSRELRNK